MAKLTAEEKDKFVNEAVEKLEDWIDDYLSNSSLGLPWAWTQLEPIYPAGIVAHSMGDDFRDTLYGLFEGRLADV
jgi:hypothetical protein